MQELRKLNDTPIGLSKSIGMSRRDYGAASNACRLIVAGVQVDNITQYVVQRSDTLEVVSGPWLTAGAASISLDGIVYKQTRFKHAQAARRT